MRQRTFNILGDQTPHTILNVKVMWHLECSIPSGVRLPDKVPPDSSRLLVRRGYFPRFVTKISSRSYVQEYRRLNTP